MYETDLYVEVPGCHGGGRTPCVPTSLSTHEPGCRSQNLPLSSLLALSWLGNKGVRIRTETGLARS